MDTPHPTDWIEDGILFSEYVGKMETEDVLKREDIVVKMLNDAKIDIIPFVLILKDVNESSFFIKIPDYGKILLHTEFFKRVSGIWTVGAPDALKKSVLPAVSRFFGQHFYFVNSLDEAIAEAKKSLVKPTSMFE